MLYLSVPVFVFLSNAFVSPQYQFVESIITSTTNNTFKPSNTQSQDSNADVTFAYDATTFLVNKPTSLVNKQQIQNHASELSAHRTRAGRMMDLDALVGDLEQSRNAKLKRATEALNQRQSRQLSVASNEQRQVSADDDGAGGDIKSRSSMNIGGKKLQIQGFIPIVGVAEDSSGNVSPLMQTEFADKQGKKAALDALSSFGGQATSPGHASFGVHRYLQTGASDQLSSVNAQASLAQLQGNPNLHEMKQQQSGSKLNSFFKRPLGISTKLQQQQQQQVSIPDINQFEQLNRCLCVPFYMCKNGFLTDANQIGKLQIEQLMKQQQREFAAARQLQVQAEKDQHFLNSPEASILTQTTVPAFDGHLDERTFSENTTIEAQQHLPDNNNNSSLLQQASNETTDYSEDILARMLGLNQLKQTLAHPLNHRTTAAQTITTFNNQQQPTSTQQSTCGLLRTCCNIPPHLFAAQNNNFFEQTQDSVVMNNQGAQQKLQQDLLTSFNPQQYTSATNQQLLVHRTLPNSQSIQQPQLLIQNSLIDQIGSSSNNALQTYHKAPTYQQQSALLNNPTVNNIAALSRRPTQPQLISSMQQNPPNPSIGMQALSSSSIGNNLIQQNYATELGSRKLLDGRCGLRQATGINGRIQNLQYGDNAADFAEYPAQVAILRKATSAGGSDNLFACGGTLISQFWIATAAHCVRKYLKSDLKVRLGEWDTSNDSEMYAHIERHVRDLIIHPEFVPSSLNNDLALLRLDTPVEASLPHINPACLPAYGEQFNGRKCWVTGWGKDAFGNAGLYQAVLREVELPVIANPICEAALRNTRLGQHFRLHQSFICAGGLEGRDACEGDGGSGLYCVEPDGLVKAVGLVSWGVSCGQAGVPGVYVSLAQARPWIENIISIDEDVYSRSSVNVSNVATNLEVVETTPSPMILSSTIAPNTVEYTSAAST